MASPYARFWRAFFLCLAAALWWEEAGRAWVRRSFFLPPAPPEASRTEPYFVALLFPKITRWAQPFTMRQKDFEAILGGLKSLGYASIGLDDLRGLYFERRQLPPKAVLIALDRDEPRAVRLADASLRRLRMRGAVFLSGGENRKGPYRRHWLSRHAIAQLSKGGAWDFGSGVSADPELAPQEFVFSTASGELRFSPGRTGFNDDRQDPRALNILPVRPGLAVEDAIIMIHKAQPRRGEFVDQFGTGRWDREWVAGWGAVSTAQRKLVLVPTPGQTGAAVFLAGTESWRDMVLEFGLERFKKNFWAYARYKDASHYVRVGATEGYWLLQERTGPLAGPSLLGRVPMREGALPARVRLVLKGDSAILYLNGAMQFGKSFTLDSSIDAGRIELGVYDKELKSAIAALSFVRAKPLGAKWVALKSEVASAPEVLDRLRQEAVEASVLSPRWLKVGEDGRITLLAGGDRQVVWSFAGYYRCRLVPQVDLSSWGRGLEPAEAAGLGARLAEQARSLEAGGLNLVLPPAPGQGTARFLEGLGSRLHEQKRELWVTWKGAPDPSWAREIDGILRPVAEPVGGLEILERLEVSRPARAGEARSGKEVALWR